MALADFISFGAKVADIGTDHGFLPVYLAQRGHADRIIASDISAASLSAARRTAKLAGVTDAVTFIVAPGLDGITQNDKECIDTIIIAGMGGETILGILDNAPWIKCKKIKLILQQQSKVDMLARFLYDNGYKIQETKSVIDKGRHYTIFLVVYNKVNIELTLGNGS